MMDLSEFFINFLYSIYDGRLVIYVKFEFKFD